MSGSRQSLVPGLSRPPPQPVFQRVSSSGNLAELGMQRASFQVGTGANGGSSSVVRASGRASAADDQRRSSVYQSRTSVANGGVGVLPPGQLRFFHQTPAPAGVPKDPRPLKDRNFQARIGQELLDYLAQNNFEMEMKHPLSQNIVRSPTQKDFNYMFQWLYHRIDPSYHFQKSIDQEVPPILRQLRYPYEKSITKSQLAAVGGQNWSTFLGLLHWMMQLARMLDGFAAHLYDDAVAEAGIDVSRDHIIFDFLSNSYRAWLALDEDASDEDVARVLAPHIDAMVRAIEQSNVRHQEELRILEAENEHLMRAIEELEAATPDPAILDEHWKIMEEDRVKFQDYISKATERSEKHEQRSAVLREELEKLAVELREAEEDRRTLQRAVDEQGINLQDIDRMTAERERLMRGIEAATGRLDEAKRRVAEREAEAARKLDELERLVDKYNTLAYQIGLIPATAPNAKGRNYELVVTVNQGMAASAAAAAASASNGDMTGIVNLAAAATDRLTVDGVTGYGPAHVLNLDLRGGATRQQFVQLRKEISERRAAALEAMQKDHELLDGIREAIEDKRNEVSALEHRVRAAEEEYDRTKEVTQAQKMASDAQIEKMEKELAKMRAQLTESVQLMEQREMNVNIE